MKTEEQNRTDKTLLHMRLQTAFLGCALLILLIVGVITISGVASLQRNIGLLEESIQSINTDQINDAVVSLTNAADTLAEVDIDTFNKTAASLQNAADVLASLNMDDIDNAIVALTDAANTLSKLDIESLNGIVSSLNNTAQTLQGAIDGLKSIFGR